MSIEIRPINGEEVKDYLAGMRQAFGWSPPTERELERAGRVPDFLERSLAVFEGGAMRATAGAFSFEMTVPGGELPTAGVTRVTVAPTHRRRGLLTAMMRRQLDDVHERGEPLAILYASEAPIYGRFGYGVASFQGELTVERGAAFACPAPRGALALVERDRALRSFPAIWAEAKPGQPGMVTREREWWEGWLEDHPDDRRLGLTPHYRLLYEADGRPGGFAVYRVRAEWAGGRPAGTIQLERLIAASPDAYAGIWRFLLDVDLVTSVRAEGRPAEEPLRLLLSDLRQARVTTQDGIWLRLVDVPAALAGRRYAAPGRLRLQVSDGFCPWNEGRYELEAGEEGATCAASTVGAELAIGTSALASAYLGGVGFRRLAAAGLVEELAEGALARADAMFASHPPPWCPVNF